LLAEKSENDYQKELKILKDKASKASPMLRRNAWVKYFNLLGKYADVKYNYALTVHKSQGSTFDNAIVINCDIKRVQDKKERNKLLYTAVTRAKNKLFVI
jgi:DNA helicase IV